MAPAGGEEVGDGADLLDGVPGPRLRLGGRDGGGFARSDVGVGVGGGFGGGKAGLLGFALAGGDRVLELGAEPADLAAGFLGRTLGVEGDKAFEDGFVEFATGALAGVDAAGAVVPGIVILSNAKDLLVVRCIRGGGNSRFFAALRTTGRGVGAAGDAQQGQQVAPAVGIQDRRIEFVVELAEMVVLRVELFGELADAAHERSFFSFPFKGKAGMGMALRRDGRLRGDTIPTQPSP